MSSLNAKAVVSQGSALFGSDDVYDSEGALPLTFRARHSGEPGIRTVPEGAGLAVSVEGFRPGDAMTSVLAGSIQGDRPVKLIVTAHRMAEVPPHSVYQVSWLIAEA